MRWKLLLFLLLIPELAFSYYVFHPCCCGCPLPHWWGSVDYMYIYRKKRFYPPLATTNPSEIPLLTNPSTTVLFGDESLGGKPKSGGRFDVGLWLNPCVGVGGGFFGVIKQERHSTFEGNHAGAPILGRPFFDTATQKNDAALISFPSVFINGKLAIKTVNYILGCDVYTRYRWISCNWFKGDFLGGFTFNRLQDNLKIDTSTLITPLHLQVSVTDQFDCRNDYYGGLLGFQGEICQKCVSLLLRCKVGLGKMVRKVHISGSTIDAISPTNRVVFSSQSGLLSQPSNIGTHTHNKFEVIPQFDATLKWNVRGHLWATVGYTFMYWPKVVLAGEQVDLDVNPTQVLGPRVGAPAPLFHEQNKNFWIQGLTAGVYVCF